MLVKIEICATQNIKVSANFHRTSARRVRRFVAKVSEFIVLL